MRARLDPGRRDTALASALSDVIDAARRIVDERIELVRVEARGDAGIVLRAVAIGAAGLSILTVAVATTTVAVVWLLALWVPIGLALVAVAAASLAIGGSLTWIARARLPGPSVELRALPPRSVGP